MSNMINCTKCGLYKTAKTNKIDFEYPKNAVIDIAFIAEAPNAEEDDSGRPLVGQAGANFNEALRLASIPRDKVFVGNIVNCRPPDNRAPNKSEISACYPYLFKVIKELKPKVIVCLGLIAAKTITNDQTLKMGEVHGRVFTGNDLLGYESLIIPTWHPSPRTFKAAPKRKQQMINDIKAAKGLVTRELNANKDWKTLGVYNLETWNKIKPIFYSADVITLDLETTTLSIFDPNASITNIGLTTSGEYGVSIVCDEIVSAGNINEGFKGWTTDSFKLFVKDLKELLESKYVVGHGVNFDIKYLLKMLDIKVNNWYWDTSIGHSLINPGDSNRLKDISWNYTNMGGYEYELAGGTHDALEKTCGRERVNYNVGDVVCTHRILEKQVNLLRKDAKRYNLARETLMPVAQVFSEMEYRGVKINQNILNDLDKQYIQKINDSKNQIFTHGSVIAFNQSIGNFNPNSSTQLAKLLFDRKFCGYPIIRKTEGKGTPSTDKRTLQILARQEGSDLCKLILDYKKISKLYSTYIKGIRPNIINNRVHTSYNLDVAITGRVSSNSPNLQNIPKDSDIKSMFEADDNHLFIDLDYKQMELVVSTYYTHDETMVEAIKSGDAHTYLAKRIFGMENITEENRRFIKTLNFGVLYGMGAGKLADNLEIDVDDARKLIMEYFKLLPFTQEWIKIQRNTAEIKGYSVSLFNRYRFYKKKADLKPGEIEEYNSAVNHPIQSCASDIMLSAMVKWRKYLVENGYHKNNSAYMLLQVHDSATTSAYENLVVKLVPDKKKVFESMKFDFTSLPLTVEIEVGKNWGKTKKVEL